MPHAKMPRLALPLILLLLALAPASALADSPALRGYAQDTGYQYVCFGQYPSGEDGTVNPVLWRVLGPGTPEAEDITHRADATNRDEKEYVRGDDLTGENADVFCLMTEYIIDVALYNEVRDERDGVPLDYEDSAIRRHLNETLIGDLFTPEEQATLVEMPGRGLISLPSRRGELHRVDYGFVAADFSVCPLRRTTGTPYAFSRGLKRVKGYSWFFTTDWRRPGFRWIVGDNGHISVAAADREGGVRLVCYVHRDKLESLGGAGTAEFPLWLEAKP